MKHKKDGLLSALVMAVIALVAGALAISMVYADEEVSVGEVNGDAVVSEREGEGEVAGEEVGEEGESSEEEAVDEKQEAEEGEGVEETAEAEEEKEEEEETTEETGKPWYRKYWWALICPAALVFFGVGVGIYYLVSWIRERRY
jgi:hypothetical protein